MVHTVEINNDNDTIQLDKVAKLFFNWQNFDSVEKVIDNHQLISTITRLCIENHHNLRQSYGTNRQLRKTSLQGGYLERNVI